MTTTAAPPDQAAGVELFDPPPGRRSFAAGDLVRLVSGLALVGAGALVAEVAQATIEGVEEDLAGAFARLPGQLEAAVLTIAQVVTSFVPLVALVVLLVRRRWRVAALLVLTGGVATLAMVLADGVVINRALAQAFADLRTENDVTAAYPTSTVIASTVAVVTVAAPWLSRRWRQTLWYSVGVLVVLRLIAVANPAFDLVLALGVGTVVGSLVLVLFGSPSAEPQPEEVLAALRADGLDPHRIDREDLGGGALRYDVVDHDGAHYDVLLRTPTERDADLLPRLYRRLRYRSSEVGTRYSTLKRRIEHEALILVLAHQAQVRAPRVVRIGTTDRGSAYLVTAPAPSAPAGPDDLARPEVLEDLWTQVGALHDAGLAHRRLALEALRVDEDGKVWLEDFDAAQTAPPVTEVARDAAALLVESALVVGADDAVAAAVRVRGAERVAPALRMLQPLALPPRTRARVKDHEGDLLDALQHAVNEATGEPDIELEHLERIKPKTVAITAVSALAFYSLLPQLADFDKTARAFGDAKPLWILAAVAASAVSYLFAAVSFQGAVTDDIPFAPNLRAQVAGSFAGLVGPAGAGGFALNARFLQRLGVSTTDAGGSVAVNAVGGFAVHLLFLVGFVVWAGSTGTGGLSLPDTQIVLLVVGVLVVIVGVLVAVPPARRKLVAPALATLKDGLAQIGRTFQNPGRVIALFGGSAGITLTYVVAVACCVEAFGGGISVPQIGAAYLVAVAVATVAPTPGGIGAIESAMIAGFTAFGLADGVAVSSTLTFRLATFWLPLLPGWLALGWMQRNDEL
ncbi:lysylphosphatidylglycerol synthase transmembrane domain-containing protein [Iamia majanohamensis]|uniref:Lysylphosphatidylglycerol synthase transmembrane domain-containing protein n=1 Tax=Iamia majanohamensis TaxID=467976 RepID=A0AAE9YHZ0_9ACTN|nr:lysylphosphatidylglycerol synthase transmembrane domain-containing protein [Iamia majanohamensis]WCO68126.1 lysylphosphatidylglycerol synthase transmembrane domain-containing protein [Iamia majanohamensis]